MIGATEAIAIWISFTATVSFLVNVQRGSQAGYISDSLLRETLICGLLGLGMAAIAGWLA